MKKFLNFGILVMVLLCLLASCTTPDQPDNVVPDGEVNNGNEQPSHIHNFDEWEILENATCTENGEKIRYCSCGEEQTKVVPALGHTEAVDEAIEATCIKSGLTEGKHCSVCDEVIVEQQIVDALGHTEVLDEAVDATCTETGLTEGKHCSVCGTVIIEQSATPKIAHTYDDKYDESCNKCGFIRDAECAHANTTTLAAVEPTCTKTGLTEGKACVKCEEIIVAQTVIDAKGHTEVVDEAVEPTCTESGLTEGKHCSVCNEVIIAQSLVDAKGHTEVVDEAVEPTCTETGLTEGKHCGVCNEVIIAQTLVNEKGHTEVIDEAVEPTCTESGLTEGKYCSVCNTVIVAQTTIDSNGHSFENRICLVCGEKDYSKGLNFTSNDDGTCYVSGIGTCTDTYIIIPPVSPNGDSVTSIGDSAFKYCTSLTSIEISESVTSIGKSAFYRCDSLTNIEIPDSVTSIGRLAFQDTAYYNNSANWLNGVLYIGNYLITANFYTSFGNYSIKDKTTVIADYAFESCHLLTSVVIPESVTNVGKDAFLNCGGLTSVLIPESVTNIDEGTFCNCRSLISIVIHESVTSIGEGAFNGCYNLVEVINKSSLNITAGSSDYGEVARDAKEVHSGESKIVNQDGYLFYTYDGINYLMGYIGDKTDLILPNNYNKQNYEIHQYAFTHMRIRSVVIPGSVTNIGAEAFYSCTSLTSVEIPDSVTSIGEFAFHNCSSLKSIEIPESVTSIGEFAFHNCSSLKSIKIPDSVTSIGSYAFTDTAYYNNAGNWTNEVLYIGNYLIEAKETISVRYTVKDGTVGIGIGAFSRCTSLTSIEIPDSVTSIGNYAFSGCTSLTSVVIGDGVTSIGDSAFEDCTSLTSVVIGDGVTTIGDFAFSNCTSLTDIYYISTEEEWEEISMGACCFDDYLINATIHYNYVP